MVYRRRGVKGWWFHYTDPQTGRQRQGKCESESKRTAEAEATTYKAELKKSFKPKGHDDFWIFVHQKFWPTQLNNLTERAMKREWGILQLHLGPFFAGRMREIGRDKLIQYIGSRIAAKANRESIRKELRILKHILRIAVKYRHLERNPFEDLERNDWPPPGEIRTRHLVGDEWNRLIQQVPIAKRAAVVLLVNSGMRRGELMGLEWSDISGNKAWIARTKGAIRTGKGRWVELTPQMSFLLSTLERSENSPKVIWQFTADALSAAFRLAVKKAKLHNFRLHDLRHSFATEARRAGAGLDVIAKLLGHSDTRQSERYAHISDESLSEAVRSIEGKFSTIH